MDSVFPVQKHNILLSKSAEIVENVSMDVSFFQNCFLIPVQKHTVLLSKSAEIIENCQHGFGVFQNVFNPRSKTYGFTK